MKSYIITETKAYYHRIDVDDDFDIEKCVYNTQDYMKKCDTGIEALQMQLKKYGDRLNYKITPEFAGDEILSIRLEEEFEG